MPQLAPSLRHLQHHAIFVPPNATSRPKDAEWELVSSPADHVPSKVSKMVMRDKDLIVAHEREIRIAHLSNEPWEVVDNAAGSYKTLVSDDLDFDILTTVLNPNGKLLAVTGRNQAVVIVLPQRGIPGSSSKVHCRSFVIDPFQFSTSSASVITKALWHPWGESGNSLWILTSDGKLREYDVPNPDDPTQTFTFLTASPASRSTFSAVDPLSRYATSFSFSPLTDFGATIVYVVCGNGDLYYMGPILPFQARVPTDWLASVKVIGDREGGLKGDWVDSLVRQAGAVEKGDKGDQAGLGGSSGTNTDERSNNTPTNKDAGTVHLHPPHLTVNGGPAPGLHRPLLRHGPVLLDPAPEELGADVDEDKATDLLVLEAGEGELVFGVCWAGGRVDLGMMLDTPSPRWISTKDRSAEEPVMVVIDSVLLPFSEDVEALENNAPRFVLDPLHNDSFYVQHSFGCDAISLKSWLTALRDDKDLPQSDVVRVVDSAGSSVKPIIGALTFCNITFGYALLALASTYQLAAVELDFGVAPVASSSDVGQKPEIIDTSLLVTRPLKLDASLNPTRSEDYRVLARTVSSAPIDALSGDILRGLAQIITRIQLQIQSMLSASKIIENHLDLCAKEFHRQIRAVKQCRAGIEGLKGDQSSVKIRKMLERQERLAARLDRAVDVMSSEYQPQVGEVERKWFIELDQLRDRIDGKVEKGLAAQTREIQKSLDELTPALTPLDAEEIQAVKASAEEYGTKQIEPLESALAQRSEEIRRLMRKMESLSVRMDMTLEEREGGD